MDDLPLRRLSANLAQLELDEAFKDCRAFNNITHLEILALKKPTWDHCKALVELPKLTHLCFDSCAFVNLEDAVVLGLLERCASLWALVLRLPGARANEGTIKLDDPRFLVFSDCMSLDDYKAEWKKSANGGLAFGNLQT